MDDDDDHLYTFHYSSFSCPFGDTVNNNNSSINNNNNNSTCDNNNNITTGAAGAGVVAGDVPNSSHYLTHNQEMNMISDLIKAQIASHPLYPSLLSSYIECRKVGAPEEMALLLEEISRENNQHITCSDIGVDPELDEFMKSYCEVLQKYKEELMKPFDEATSFLSNIESQLSNLCKETLVPMSSTVSSSTYHSAGTDEGGCPSDEDIMSCGELIESHNHRNQDQFLTFNRQGDRELKEMLMRKYSGYLSSLKKEFLKKRKKGKLPKESRTALLDWWNSHYRWPYPTEDEKNRLSDITGLDQKQINNWFINQRKRHWKPSEDMRFALMEGVSGGGAE